MGIQIKVHGVIPGFTIGETYDIETDDRGVPLELMWRRRIRDSMRDKCCEIVTGSKTKKSKRAAVSEPTETGSV